MLLKLRWILLFALGSNVYAINVEQKEQLQRKPEEISKKEATEKLKILSKNSLGKMNVSNFPKHLGGNQDLKTAKFPTYYDVKNGCLSDENQYTEVESLIIKDWITSWLNKSSDGLVAHLAKDKVSIDEFLVGGESTKIDHITQKVWTEQKSLTDKNEIALRLNNYLQIFTKIEDFNLVAKSVYAPKFMRNKNFTIKEMRVEYYYDLRGIVDSAKREDRGYIEVQFKQYDKNWKIVDVQIKKMDSLQTSTPTFSEATSATGVDKLASYERVEAIRRGGYALAISTGLKGQQEMYVGAYGPGKLLRKNKANDSFYEVKDSGIEDHLYVKSAIFADFNNDGNEDLLLVRFTPNKDKNEKRRRTDLVIYQSLGNGKYKNVGNIAEDSLTDYAMPAAVADFNNDGLLDIYIGYPGHKDFTTFSKDIGDKKLLKAQGVYLNKSDFKFEPLPMTDLKENNFEKFTHFQKLFPHSAMAVDFNQDGKVDIMVVDDRGNLSPAYLNLGDGKFSQVNDVFNIANVGYGMGIASADLNNDSLTDLLVTNVKFASTERLAKSCLQNWDLTPDFSNRMLKDDISVYMGTKYDNDKKFVEMAKKIGFTELGDGLGGIETLDYDNDGCEDVYVTNGLWSGTNRFEDLSSIFDRSELAAFERVFMENKNSTQSVIMQILRNYKGSLNFSKKSDDRISLGGFQRNRLYKNKCDGTFVEVGFLEGVDSIADGYIVTKADLRGSGKQDLILRNADPGTAEVKYSPVQVYFNNSQNNNSLRIKLIGSKSNKDAIGAEVKVIVDDKKTLTKQLIANAGTSQSEKTLHFGIGSATKVKLVKILWPSGKKTELRNINSGEVTILEENDSVINKLSSY